MAFGRPTKYWRLDIDKVPHGSSAWDKGVIEASNIYKKRMVNTRVETTFAVSSVYLLFIS